MEKKDIKKENAKKKLLYKYLAAGIAIILVIGIAVGTYLSNTKADNRINILCMGIDKFVTMTERHPDTNSIGQADVVFLVSIDTKKEEMDIIAIPRDTIVTVEKYNSRMEYIGIEDLQLCLQYAYADGTTNSCELTQKRVNEIFEGVTIDAYAAINFSGIMQINDAIGGVEITMKEDYTVHNPKFVKGATLLLKGTDALDFVQKRDITVAHTAYTRIDRQKQYLNEFVKKAKTVVKENPTVISDLYSALKENMVTNLEVTQVVDIVKTAINCPFETINFHKIEGEIINDGTYECFYPDERHIKKLTRLLK